MPEPTRPARPARPGDGVVPRASGPNAYAHWGVRVGASLLDAVYTLPALAIVIVGSNVAGIGASGADRNPVGVALIIAGYFGMLLIAGWNRWIVAGRTGQSWGRRMLRIRLLGAQSGRPVGFPLAFGRDVTHLLDSFCLVGYLWPLWDSRRQTFADKVCGTVVVPQPAEVPPAVGGPDPLT